VSSLLGILAMIALFVGFFAAGVTFYSYRERDWVMMRKAGGVLAVCVAVYLIAPKAETITPTGCERWSRFASEC
jgi:hypothetical protein